MFYIWITLTMLFCFFELIYLCFSLDILWDVCLWSYVFHQISSIKLLWYKVYGIRFRSEIICSSYRITTIVLWAKPFGCEKLNKRDFKLLSRCFFHLCISLYALNIKFGQTTETYSPQTFSVTAAVVAPAIVICLNSLLCPWEARPQILKVRTRNAWTKWVVIQKGDKCSNLLYA